MPIPATGVTRWFRDSNGKVSQINNVSKITFGSPLVANSYYRDKPPIIVGGAAGLLGASGQIAIAGGTDPQVTLGAGTITIEGDSSVLQDDDFTHEPLRFIWAPTPMVFFAIVDGTAPTNPDTTTFPIDRPEDRTAPKDTFDTFDVDCVFAWGEDCAIFNVAPPGWSVGDSGPAT